MALDGPFTYLKCNNATALTITGALIDSGNIDGARVIVAAVNAEVNLLHQHGGSTTSNRFIGTQATTITLVAYARALMIYDGTTARWRVSRVSFSKIWELATGYVGIGQASPSAKLDVVINEAAVYAGRFFNDMTNTGHGLLVETDGTASGTNAFYVVTDKAGAAHVAMKILGSGKIGIGAGPTSSSELAIASTTGAFVLPRMTTAQRDALTPLNGMIIYNTTTTAVEAYEAGAWGNL